MHTHTTAVDCTYLIGRYGPAPIVWDLMHHACAYISHACMQHVGAHYLEYTSYLDFPFFCRVFLLPPLLWGHRGINSAAQAQFSPHGVL